MSDIFPNLFYHLIIEIGKKLDVNFTYASHFDVFKISQAIRERYIFPNLFY